MKTTTTYQVIANGLGHSKVMNSFDTRKEAEAYAKAEFLLNEGWDGEIELSIVEVGVGEAVEAEASMAASDFQKFAFAGNATFTVVSKKTGKRFTYRIRRAKGDEDNRPWFVSVMTGSDNESSYTYAGCVFPKGPEFSKFIPGKKPHHVKADSLSSRGFSWLLGHIKSESALESNVEIFHAGTCGRCGRKLTVPESIQTGIGPECAKHI